MPKLVEVISEAAAKPIDPRLGQRIRIARKERGWSIKELAQKVGCSTTHLTRIELAQRRADSMILLRSFAEVLDIPVDELLVLAGQDAADQKSHIQLAFPSIRTDLQEKVMIAFANIVGSIELTEEQLGTMLEQCTAYADYCQRKNKKKL